MRLLHLYWPHLPIRLARARHSDSFPTDRPVVLGGQPWTDGTVIDADPAARALGVRRGIPLGSGHRLAPEAAFLDPEPEADAAAVEAAFETLARFSPGLAGTTDPADPAFGLIELQATGSTGCGAPSRCSSGVSSTPSTPILPGAPRPGIAGTRFAATVAAGHASRRSRGSSEPGGDAALPRAAAGVAAHPGSRRPGSPRAGSGCAGSGRSRSCRGRALVARFGDGGRAAPRPGPGRGDRAVPAAARPGATRPRPADRARRSRRLDSLRFVLHRLAGALADQLEASGDGRRPGAPPADPRPRLRPARARPPSSSSSSASPSRPPTPRRSSGSSSPGSSGRRRRRRSRGSSWSWPASSRPSVSSCRCSSRRRRGMPGSAGSSPGSR